MSNRFIIDGDVMIWYHAKRIVDKSRQFKNEDKDTNNMKSPTLPKNELEKFKNFFNVQTINLSKDNVFQVVGEFYIDIDKFWQHIDYIKAKFHNSLFQGNAFSFEKLENFKQKTLSGTISFGLRAGYRKEFTLNFGKKTPMRNGPKITYDDKLFENFIFGGFFGGEYNGINYNFVTLRINRVTREIDHVVDDVLLEKALSDLYIYKQDTTNQKLLDYIDEHNLSTVEQDLLTITRERDLSVKHNKLQNFLNSFMILKGFKTFMEYNQVIDLYAHNNEKNIIFEIKTSQKEVYKAIGQLLSYQFLVNEYVEKIIITDEKYVFSDHISKALDKYEIKYYHIADYVKDFI